jgi:GntR family transcriptional regulator
LRIEFIVFILYIVYTQQRGNPMKIIVSNRSGVPIYEQIKDHIKAAIFAGELRENDVLPSIRQLARDLKISVITTTRAYSDLEQEGFVVNVQGKGCYVLPRNKELARENAMHRMEDALSAAIAAAKAENIGREEVAERLNLLWEADYE